MNILSKIVIANWKMNGTKETVRNFLSQIDENITKLTLKEHDKIILALPYIFLNDAIYLTQKSKFAHVNISAQNCNQNTNGAYTGEVNSIMLHDIQCKYTILGHSERRIYFHETNEIVASKYISAVQNSIQPIICIGENAKEDFIKVIKAQLDLILLKIDLTNEWHKELIIAYEPVWAIGTGTVPTIQEIQEKSQIIREIVSEKHNKMNVQILYGGSVNEKNITDICKIINNNTINGVLVGNASLIFEQFFAILNKVFSLE